MRWRIGRSQWLGTVKSSRFFGWLHFYDAHSPYAPPEPYRAPLCRSAVRRRDRVRRCADRPGPRVSRAGGAARQDDRRHRRRSRGEPRRSRRSTHGFFVYQSVLQRAADRCWRRTTRCAAAASPISCAPSTSCRPSWICSGCRPATRSRDRAWCRLMTGAVREMGLAAYAEAVYPRYHYGWSDLRSLTSDRFKFIDAPRPELYDLAQDPARRATSTTSGGRSPIAWRRSSARPTRRRVAVTPAADVDPDTRARLAALGYVGTFVATPAADRSQLADPKDKIDLFNLVIDAREQIHDEHDSEGGLQALRQVVARDPQVVDAWLMMGNEYSRRREFSRALDAFQRALALEAGLRPRGLQPGQRLPDDRQGRRGAGRLPAAAGARPSQRPGAPGGRRRCSSTTASSRKRRRR